MTIEANIAGKEAFELAKEYIDEQGLSDQLSKKAWISVYDRIHKLLDVEEAEPKKPKKHPPSTAPRESKWHGRRFGHIEFDGMITAETEKAVLLCRWRKLYDQSANNAGSEWIPKSHLRTITYKDGGDSKEVKKNAKIESVEISEWIAKEKGWL